MARKLTYNTTRFDGGMTDNVRILDDVSKCAFSSHFDIYSSPEELRVMPGYVADEGLGADPIGMRDYKVRAFNFTGGALRCAGELAAGGGTKVFAKNLLSATFFTDDWVAGTSTSHTTNSEATSAIQARPLAALYGRFNTEVHVTTANSGSFRITRIAGGGATTEAYFDIARSVLNPITVIDGIGSRSDRVYMNVESTLIQDTGSAGSSALSMLGAWAGSSTLTRPFSMYESVRGMWYLVRTASNYCELRLWDRESTLNDLSIPLPNTTGGVVGEAGGAVVVVANEALGDATELTSTDARPNGSVGFSVKVFDGYSFATPFRQIVPTPVGSLMVALGQHYKGSILFYARFATNSAGTTFREGIWALGRRDPNRPVALSLLMDMNSLGQFNGYRTFENHHYFAHGTDWRISRLDRFDTGTYDVPATYETLFYGAGTPFLKGLEGITVRSQTLPSGATIEVQYRTDPDGTWTSMGTATSGKKHNFTRANGVPIGRFQEIQFRIIATGKIVITGISVGLTESDDLPYSL